MKAGLRDGGTALDSVFYFPYALNAGKLLDHLKLAKVQSCEFASELIWLGHYAQKRNWFSRTIFM